MDSVGRAALEGALAGGVGAAVGAAGLSGAAAFAVSEGADFIGGFLYDIGVNGLSREQALINGLAGIGFGGAIGLLGRGLSRAARNVNLPLPNNLRRQCASFSADTLIATPDGDKPISEIEVGDVILAYSEATEEVDLYHVSATHTQRHDSTLDITIDGETLHTTDEHPFYVVRDDQEQWVKAQDLHIGDSVLSGLGETGIVEDIIIIDQPQTMYNLTVSLVATYLVGDGQWVVHNQGIKRGLQIAPWGTTFDIALGVTEHVLSFAWSFENPYAYMAWEWPNELLRLSSVKLPKLPNRVSDAQIINMRDTRVVLEYTPKILDRFGAEVPGGRIHFNLQGMNPFSTLDDHPSKYVTVVELNHVKNNAELMSITAFYQGIDDGALTANEARVELARICDVDF